MTIKLTSKRQATFPAALCHDLGLHPGDEIELESRVEKGRKFWVLQTPARLQPLRPWFGALRSYARNAKGKHDMASIRAGIAKKRPKTESFPVGA